MSSCERSSPVSADLERPTCSHLLAQRLARRRKEWKTEDNVQLGKKMIFVPFYVGKTKLWTVMLHRNPVYGARAEEFGKSSPFLREMRDARKERFSDLPRCVPWNRGRATGRAQICCHLILSDHFPWLSFIGPEEGPVRIGPQPACLHQHPLGILSCPPSVVQDAKCELAGRYSSFYQGESVCFVKGTWQTRWAGCNLHMWHECVIKPGHGGFRGRGAREQIH